MSRKPKSGKRERSLVSGFMKELSEMKANQDVYKFSKIIKKQSQAFKDVLDEISSPAKKPIDKAYKVLSPDIKYLIPKIQGVISGANMSISITKDNTEKTAKEKAEKIKFYKEKIKLANDWLTYFQKK